MKNNFLIVCSLLTFFGFAQNNNTLLYKVYSNGSSQPSYIFGTMHITCDAKLDATTIKALDATSQLCLELNMDDPELQSKMMKSMAMKDDMKISSLVSAEDFAILDSYLKSKMNVPAAAFDTYKPFMLSALFLTTLLDCTPQSIETELVRYSKSQNEPVLGLETVEEQMNVFDQIPYQLQAEELITSVKSNFKNDKIELDAMLNSYAKKDTKEMQNIIESSKSLMNGEYKDVLLKERNQNWVSRIERIMTEAPTFFGVGAAHLLGPDSVLILLQNRGFIVEPMYP